MVGLLAIAQLANNGEEIGRVQALEFFIESARGAKVSKFERAAGVFDAVAQNVQRAAFSISDESRLRNRSLTSLPWCCLSRSHIFACVA